MLCLTQGEWKIPWSFTKISFYKCIVWPHSLCWKSLSGFRLNKEWIGGGSVCLRGGQSHTTDLWQKMWGTDQRTKCEDQDNSQIDEWCQDDHDTLQASSSTPYPQKLNRNPQTQTRFCNIQKSVLVVQITIAQSVFVQRTSCAKTCYIWLFYIRLFVKSTFCAVGRDIGIISHESFMY